MQLVVQSTRAPYTTCCILLSLLFRGQWEGSFVRSTEREAKNRYPAAL